MAVQFLQVVYSESRVIDNSAFFPFARIFLNSKEKQLFASEKYGSLIIAMFETFFRKYLHIPWRILNNDFFLTTFSIFHSYITIGIIQYSRYIFFLVRKNIAVHCTFLHELVQNDPAEMWSVFLWTSGFFLNVTGLLFPNWLIVCCCLAEENNLIEIVLVFFFN